MEGEGFPPQRMKLKGSQAPGKAALVSTEAGGPTTRLALTWHLQREDYLWELHLIGSS